MRTGKFILIASFFLQPALLIAQGRYFTKTGRISFYSSTSVENIEAINKSVAAAIDTKTGDLQFVVLMKGFEFKKALMQEDFNRDYVESSKYPKAEFKGQIINNSEITYAVDGNYTAKAKGKLTIHGQTKDVETTGTLNVKDGRIHIKSVFNVQIADYKIIVRKLYKDHISSIIKVTVDCLLEPAK
jgi:hypothetical protein